MAETAHLKLPVLEAGQAQKHVTVNEALGRLDALTQLAVLDSDRTVPPALPEYGDRHIVAAGATGAWAGQDQRIALWQGGVWTFLSPEVGWGAFDASAQSTRVWNGTAWAEGVIRLGVGGAAPDATNRLAVASDAVLFNHAGDGVQVKLNKSASGETGALLFQTGFSGRAEIGLAGDDDLHVKVSADGSSYTEALTVAAATGAVALAVDLAVAHGGTGGSTAAAARTNLGAAAEAVIERFTASGTWTKPAGARLVFVTLTGGGGGGGGGGKAAVNAAVSGGGGGGGGGRSERWFEASELGASVAVTIGAGGAGGAGAAVNGAGGNGSAGVTTAFGSVFAFGGGGGSGGNAAAASGGGGGGSMRAAGGSASGATGGAVSSSVVGGAGGSGASGTSVGTISGGGGGGGAPAAGGAGSVGGAGFHGGGGGGAGGGVTAANVFSAGGAAFYATSAAGSGGGATDAAAGTAGPAQTTRAAAGGGGGAGSVSGLGGAGGEGGAPGGGGGGGGASHGGNGGDGGAGGRGEALIITFF